MGVRFRSEFYSQHNNILWRCDIIDTTYSSSITNIRTYGEGFTLTYENQGDERFNPIKGSTCNLKVLITDDAAGLSIQSWLNNFVQATKEDQYFIGIYKNGDLFWFGGILPDLGTREDISRPYEYELSATDGLARLKTYYNPLTVDEIDTPFSINRQSFQNIIYSILKLCPLYLATTETILYSSVVGWYENQMAAKSGPLDPLAITEVNVLAYSKKGENEEQIPLTAYEVLEDICRSWGMRVMFSNGRYRFYQVNSYEDDGITKYERTYRRSDGTFFNWATFDGYNTDLTNDDYPYVTSGNQFQFYAPLKYVKLKYPFLNANLLDSLTSMPYDSFTSSYKYEKTLRANLIGGTSKKLNFGMSFDFIFRSTPTATQYNLRFDIKIKLGTNYLRKSTFSSAVTWTTNAADVYSVLFPITTLGGSYQNLTIMFTTPDIPAGVHNANEIVVDLASVTFALTAATVSRFDYGIFRVIDSSTLLYNTSADNEEESYFEYIAGNTASPINSYDLELEDALVGEPIDPSSYGNLFVYDGASWVQSTGLWRLEDTGTTFDFNLLRVREILAGQTKATQKYQGGIIGILDAHSSFDYNGFVFILNGATYSAITEKFDGEWYAVSPDRATFAEISGATNEAGSGGDVQLRRSIGGLQSDVGNALYQLNQADTYMSSLSANTTLISINQFVEVTTAVTITLPPAASWLSFGKSCEITIKNTAGASDTVTVAADGSERIDGAATQTLSQYRSIVLASNGTAILIKSRL